MPAGLSVDQTVQPQTPQLIRELSRGAGSGVVPTQLCEMHTQLFVAKTTRKQTEQQQQVKQQQHQFVAVRQGRSALRTDLERGGNLAKHVFAYAAILAGSLDVEKTSVGGEAKLP